MLSCSEGMKISKISSLFRMEGFFLEAYNGKAAVTYSIRITNQPIRKEQARHSRAQIKQNFSWNTCWKSPNQFSLIPFLVRMWKQIILGLKKKKQPNTRKTFQKPKPTNPTPPRCQTITKKTFKTRSSRVLDQLMTLFCGKQLKCPQGGIHYWKNWLANVDWAVFSPFHTKAMSGKTSKGEEQGPWISTEQRYRQMYLFLPKNAQWWNADLGLRVALTFFLLKSCLSASVPKMTSVQPRHWGRCIQSQTAHSGSI